MPSERLSRPQLNLPLPRSCTIDGLPKCVRTHVWMCAYVLV